MDFAAATVTQSSDLPAPIWNNGRGIVRFQGRRGGPGRQNADDFPDPLPRLAAWIPKSPGLLWRGCWPGTAILEQA